MIHPEMRRINVNDREIGSTPCSGWLFLSWHFRIVILSYQPYGNYMTIPREYSLEPPMTVLQSSIKPENTERFFHWKKLG